MHGGCKQAGGVKAVPNPAEGARGCVTAAPSQGGAEVSFISFVHLLHSLVSDGRRNWRTSIARGLDEGAF